MASFGEIMEPSSRYTWEEGDDFESGYNLPKLQWQVPLQIPQEIVKFFIFEGKCLWNGVSAKKTLVEVNCIKEANLHLYKTPNNNYFVVVVKDFDLLLCNDIVRSLKDLIIRSKMIVSVQEKPMSEYQCDQPPETPHIIRKITTTNKVNLMKENMPKLEQPNIITGVSAGVFSMREQLGLSATAIAIFMEPQESQLEDIEELMQKMNMSGAAQVNPNAVWNSNLYT